eukprot:359009-Chlamydomonas_euryale.AAC.3
MHGRGRQGPGPEHVRRAVHARRRHRASPGIHGAFIQQIRRAGLARPGEWQLSIQRSIEAKVTDATLSGRAYYGSTIV